MMTSSRTDDLLAHPYSGRRFERELIYLRPPCKFLAMLTCLCHLDRIAQRQLPLLLAAIEQGKERPYARQVLNHTRSLVAAGARMGGFRTPDQRMALATSMAKETSSG